MCCAYSPLSYTLPHDPHLLRPLQEGVADPPLESRPASCAGVAGESAMKRSRRMWYKHKYFSTPVHEPEAEKPKVLGNGMQEVTSVLTHSGAEVRSPPRGNRLPKRPLTQLLLLLQVSPRDAFSVRSSSLPVLPPDHEDVVFGSPVRHLTPSLPLITGWCLEGPPWVG